MRPRFVEQLFLLVVLAIGTVTIAAGRSAAPDGHLMDHVGVVNGQFTLDLRADVAASIGKTTIPTRSTLARGLTIAWSGERPVEVVVAFTVIGDSKISAFYSTSFTVKTGANRLPGEEAIPRSINHTFSPGDQFLRSGASVRGDQLEEETTSIAKTGLVYGRTEVDWERQHILHIGVVPSTGARAVKGAPDLFVPLPREVSIRTIAVVRSGR